MKIQLRKELWRVPDLLGFSAHWIWIWCVFWSDLFYQNEQLVAEPLFYELPLESLWIVSLSANVITIGILLAVSYFRNPFSHIKGLPLFASITTMLGTLCVTPAVLPFAGPALGIVFTVGSIMTGIGSGIIVVLWGELFASLGARKTINYSVISLLLASVIYLALTTLPSSIAPVIVAFLPILSMGCFKHFKHSLARQPRSERNTRVREKPPLSLVVISLLFGVSFGVMKGLLSPFEPALIEMRDILNIIAIICATVAIFVTTSIFKLDFDRLTYRIALPLMAAGFLFLPLHEWWTVIGTGIHQFGYQYFYIILWSLWPILAAQGKVPSGWIVCWGMVSIQLGQLLGSICSVLYLGAVGTTGFTLAMTSAFCIFLILLAALLFSGKESANTGWGFVKPIEEADSPSPLERTCTYLARQNRLSPREIEVFFLLAKGRNRAHIRDELIISDETTKTHIKNVYRKIQVHSQQELIDMVEEVASAS